MFQIYGMSIQSIAVFCGSRKGNNPLFEQAAQRLSQLLAEHKVTIVYGGGNAGLMGVVANSALENNGNVIGIMPLLLREQEYQHDGLSELHVVDSMHTRKCLMYEKCDAAIILPGGFGTLDEVFEMLTWNQLNIHSKRVFFLNTDGFYTHLLRHMEMMKTQGFLYDHPNVQIEIIERPEALLPFL